MPQFHETGYGRTYYEHTLPELTRQLTRIADALEKLNETKETKAAPAPKVKTQPGMTKRSPGDYILEIENDSWHIYKDSYSYTRAWRGDLTRSAGDHQHFKESTKQEVLKKIYEYYGNKSPRVSGETGIGDD